MRLFLASMIAATLSAPLAAQEAPPPPVVAGQDQPPQGMPLPAFTDPTQLFGSQAGAFFGLGFGKIGGDVYASTIINTDFSLGPVGLGLALPLNLLIANNSNCPADPFPCTREEKTYFSVLRKRDWDEPQDWLRFIRYIRYGRKRDPLYVVAGQLWGATIGHGTLVNRYANSLSLDHPKFGLAVDVNTTYFGIESFADSLANPTVVGGRVYLRPFGETPIARGLAIGASLVTDRIAPLTVPGAADEQGNLQIGQSRTLYALGVDIEYELLRNSLISLVPYVDGNRLAGAGNGLHIGVLTTVNFPIPIFDVGLQARLEYRVMKPGYLPEYFDQLYDLGRFQHAAGSSKLPKLRVAEAALAAGGKTIQGYYGELAFNFAGFVQIGGVYQDYDGDAGASLGLFATFPKIEIVKLSAYYLRKNFNGLSQAFELDEKSLLAASAAYRVFGPLYLRIDFSRQWVVDPVEGIKGVNTFNAGLATFLPF